MFTWKHPFAAKALQQVVLLCLAWGLLGLGSAHALRIKEVATVEGVRSNQLTGFGLIVGLDGTGDQTTQMPYTAQGMANYLQQMGISLTAASLSQLQMKNVAAVLVTAQLPPFARPGQLMDVNVSSVGNAKSLKGGTLIATPLKGADGEIYAIAQGNLIVAGAGAAAGGSKVQVNHLSAGRIPDGAQVERTVPTPLQEGGTVNLSLNALDFQTARKVAQAINQQFGSGVAQALDGRTVQVKAPTSPNERVNFLAELEELPVVATVAPAKVVINAHGLHRTEPGRFTRCVRHCTWQPVYQHQQHPCHQPTQPVIHRWSDRGGREIQHRNQARRRQTHPGSGVGPADRGRQGPQCAGCDPPGSAGDLAGYQVGRCAQC